MFSLSLVLSNWLWCAPWYFSQCFLYSRLIVSFRSFFDKLLVSVFPFFMDAIYTRSRPLELSHGWKIIYPFFLFVLLFILFLFCLFNLLSLVESSSAPTTISNYLLIHSSISFISRSSVWMFLKLPCISIYFWTNKIQL